MNQGFKLGQVEKAGKKQVLIIQKDEVCLFKKDTAPSTTLEIIQSCQPETGLSKKIMQLADQFGLVSVGRENMFEDPACPFKLLKPIDAPEIWAVGVTYKRQAVEHDKDIEKKTGRIEQLYQYVYQNKRAEIFFKGFDRTCSGPQESLILRADSEQVLPEAEMVLVLGQDHLPIAYTMGNDLTAWDIERECPLYLNQAKIWDASCSIGPFLIPADSFGDPYACSLRCQVFRNNEQVIDSQGSTADLKRSIEELCFYLTFNNTIPSGTLLFTGTACVIPHDFYLQDGDKIIISSAKFGTLSNATFKSEVIHRPYVFRS